MTAFLASGADVADSGIAESIAECAQGEMAAFYSCGRASSFGAMVDKRVHSHRPKSELHIDERRKNMQKAKSKRHCHSCGQRGLCPSKGGGKGDKGGRGKSSGKGGSQTLPWASEAQDWYGRHPHESGPRWHFRHGPPRRREPPESEDG